MNLMNFGKKALVVAAFAGLGAVPAVAGAAQINALLNPGLNEIQDTDAERVLRDGVAVTSGAFQLGDVLQAILRFDTANAETISDFIPAPYKLTAYSELRVIDIQGSQEISGVAVPTGAACAPAATTCSLIFGATGNLGVNVLASLYEGTQFSQTVAANTAVAQITGSTKVADIGYGKAEDYWYATIVNPVGGDQIGLLTLVSATSGQRGQFNFGVSLLNNPGGLPVAEDGMTGVFGDQHDVIGNGSAYARSPNVNTEWLLSSNTLIQFQAVPEPGSLALMGALVIAAGAVTMRRKQSKA